MIGTFDWSTLQAFLVLMRTERLTVAAREARIDHATLKRRITALEEGLGTTLFERTPSGYVLTPAGRNVAKIIEEMESASLQLAGTKPGLKNTAEGVIRIAAPDVFGQRFLAPRIGALADVYPALKVELVTTPRPTDLTKREADIAITGQRPQQGRLHSRKLTDYELGLYATQTYLNLSSPIRSRSDLQSHRLVGFIDDLILAPEMNYLADIDPALKPAISTTSGSSQSVIILADAGVAVLPCWLASEETRLVRVLSNDVALLRSYWLVYSSDMRDIVAVRAVCDFISSQVDAASARFYAAPARSRTHRKEVPRRPRS